MSDERHHRFRALMEHYGRAVLAYALRRCPARCDAEDVVQKTFEVAWRRLEHVPRGEGTLPWLYGVARNVLHNEHRGVRRRSDLATRLAGAYTETGGDELEASDEMRAVLAALANLNGKDQEILLLHAWEGLSHSKIAVVLGCTENACAIRLHRARQRLEDTLAKGMGPSRTETPTNGRRGGRRQP